MARKIGTFEIVIIILVVLAICYLYSNQRTSRRRHYKSPDYYEGFERGNDDPLAVFDGQNQAFCANTWCGPGTDGKTVCQCPVFNSYGLAPLSSMKMYDDDPKVIVSTYDILEGTKQPAPQMCFGNYIDCYGQPCYPNYSDQSVAQCQCKVRFGPFLTASKSCGPDERGYLPNGAEVAKSDQGIATANSIIEIINSSKTQS